MHGDSDPVSRKEREMLRLMFILHTVIATTLMGIGITAVLAAGMTGTRPIVIAAIAGLAAAFPASWLVARQMIRLSEAGGKVRPQP
jgi:preprotein translocase subunit SecF